MSELQHATASPFKNMSCTPGEKSKTNPIYTFFFPNHNATQELEELPAWDVSLKIFWYTVIMMIAVVGNSIVLSVIAGHKKLRSPANLLIANMAVCDFFISTLSATMHLGEEINSNWPFGSSWCKFSAMIFETPFTVYMLSLTMLALERFLVITHPFSIRWTSSLMSNIIAFTWLAALTFTSPHLFTRCLYRAVWKDRAEIWCGESWPEYYQDKSCKLWSPWRVSFYWFEFIVGFWLPIACIIIFYLFTYTTLMFSRDPVLISEKHKQMSMKNIKMFILLTILAVVCYTPYRLIRLRDRALQDIMPSYSTHVWGYVFKFIAHMKSSISPILVIYRIDRFRDRCIKTFRCSRLNRNARGSTASSSSTDSSCRNPTLVQSRDSCEIPRLISSNPFSIRRASLFESIAKIRQSDEFKKISTHFKSKDPVVKGTQV